MLTQEYLKTLLHYDQETGIFIWIKSGKIAGTVLKGHIRIIINYKGYYSHRLAWLYVHNYWPKEIDHINGIRNDNKIKNLREVTTRENAQNKKIHRDGKLVGASFIPKTKKWYSCIKLNGKTKNLGYYNTEQEAHEIYIKHYNFLKGNLL